MHGRGTVLKNRRIKTPRRYSIPELSPAPFYTLSGDSLIGRGNKRDCHVHPDHPDLCIKVARDPERWEECHQQSVVEWYYLSHLQQREIPFDHLVACHGWVQTNRGIGLVLERVRDEKGSTAPTLGQALASGSIDHADALTLLARLKAWALKHAVVITDFSTKNLILRHRNGRRELVLVDGIGSRRAEWKFTLYQTFAFLSRRKTRRQWKRQGDGLLQSITQARLLPSNEAA